MVQVVEDEHPAIRNFVSQRSEILAGADLFIYACSYGIDLRDFFHDKFGVTVTSISGQSVEFQLG